jgi:uncharacterized alpha-E superfamily protein
MSNLLANSAERLFWLARYLERVENLARIIEITETIARDSSGRNWFSVVQINADEKAFTAKHPVATDRAVVEFYFFDPANPTSVPASLQEAHQNARALRPIISIEMWEQVNVMRHHWREQSHAALAPDQIPRLCRRLREQCEINEGIVEGSLSQDEAWFYYRLGKSLERADQTTRLLDIKYHLLLPPGSSVGSALDSSQWNALLRAANGYQAFRRVYQGRMTPAAVAGFLLFSDSFPRSVSLCVRNMAWLLAQLRFRYGLSRAAPAEEKLDEMRALLSELTVEAVIEKGLHEFLDGMQRQFIALTDDIRKAFFGHS